MTTTTNAPTTTTNAPTDDDDDKRTDGQVGFAEQQQVGAAMHLERRDSLRRSERTDTHTHTHTHTHTSGQSCESAAAARRLAVD